MTSSTILVIGGTGQQGGAVVRALGEHGHQVRVLTRRPDGDAARALRASGVEIAAGDATDAEAVRRAAAGVDAVFAMTTPFESGADAEREQGIALVDALEASEAPYVVYSSVASALDGTGIPHFESKAAIERHLTEVATRSSVVAPAAFLENVDAPWVAPEIAQGRYPFGVPGDLPVQQVAVADLAAFAVLVLEHPERFAGQRVEVASVEVTGDQLAEVLTRTTGHLVEYVEVPVAAVREQGDEDLALMLEFFRAGGYTVDLPALRAAYPEVAWHDLDDWAADRG